MSYFLCGICGQGYFMGKAKICSHCDRLCTRKDCFVCTSIQRVTTQLDKQLPPRSSRKQQRWDDDGPGDPLPV